MSFFRPVVSNFEECGQYKRKITSFSLITYWRMLVLVWTGNQFGGKSAMWDNKMSLVPLTQLLSLISCLDRN